MAQSAARKRSGASRRSVLSVVEAEPATSELTPVYAAALLKISLELKRPDARGLDAVLAQVLDGLGIDPAAFRAYLTRNFSLLQATARSRAY